MNLSTTTTVQSELYPEVRFTFRKFSEKRRQDFTAVTAEHRYKLREHLAELEALKVAEGTEPDPITTAKISNASDRINHVIQCDINPQWINFYLKAVDGLMIDEQPCTVELFLSDAPSDLYNEAIKLIQSQAELGDSERKN